jgi:ribose 5-phosphate isomerase A
MDELEQAKKAAGYKATAFIKDGMVVGLGSGTTAAFFIEKLSEKINQGLKVDVVSSSAGSKKLAEHFGLQVLDINEVSSIDVTVDGADEIDQNKNMIKGAGAAHVREKILASSSHEMIVIVDETKLVAKLGQRPLPVEILPYGHLFTQKKIEKLGFEGSWRKENSQLHITDNENYLFDIKLPSHEIKKFHEMLIDIPGVIDTGFFTNLAGRVIVGYKDGSSTVR